MNCHLEFVRPDGDRFIHRCSVCNREVRSKYRDPSMRKQACGIAGPPTLEQSLRPAEKRKLEAAAGGKLLGDWIADLTTAIGIPPCGGCEKRKAWLNAAHAWLLGIAPSDPASNPPDAPQP
jgi:hypothetical protein